MSNSNILLGPKYSSSTFEEELENTFLDDFLVAANKRRFNDVYLIHASTNEILNSKIFVEQSYNVAAELQSFGCNRDSRTLVGILSENRLEYPIVILGTLLTGAALICYNPAFTDEDLRREFKNTKLTILFCSPEHYNNLKRIAHPPTKIIVFDSKTSLDASPYLKFSQLSQSTTKAYSDPGPRRTDDLAFVLYTSGTTGTPKGVMLTHKNMVYMLKLLTEEKLMEVRGLKSVSIAPMFHAYGLISLLFAIPESRTLFIMPTFDERLFLQTIKTYNIRQLRLTPALILNLLKDPKVDEYDFSRLESVSYGDAPLRTETENALKEKFGLKYVQQGYGMTECTLITTIQNVQSTSKPTSCGSVLPGALLKIVCTRTKETLGKNKSGEICIKGPHVMQGYFRNPEATSEILDEEGWLHSGDVGYYDEDEELFIMDRAKELIIYKGFRVAPADLEGFLLTHPKIADCGVIGIPDDVAGEIPIAFVVKGSGAKVTEQEIIQFVEGRVLSPLKLKGVEFVSRIPKTPTGKSLRRELHRFWTLKRTFPSLGPHILLDFVCTFLCTAFHFN